MFKEPEPAKKSRRRATKSKVVREPTAKDTVRKPTRKNSIKIPKKAPKSSTKKREVASVKEKIGEKIKRFIFKDYKLTKNPEKKRPIKNVARSKVVSKPTDKKIVSKPTRNSSIKKFNKLTKRDNKKNKVKNVREKIKTKITGFIFKEPEPIKKSVKEASKSKKPVTEKKTTPKGKRIVIKNKAIKINKKKAIKQIKQTKKKVNKKDIIKKPVRIVKKSVKIIKKQVKKPIAKPATRLVAKPATKPVRKKIQKKNKTLLTKKNAPTKKRKKVKPAAKRLKKITKNVFPLTLVKSSENPVISPQAENYWEAWQTFNPGVILLNGKVHFLYRAIGQDGISRLGYAVSSDGFNIDERLPYPVYEHQCKQCQFNIYSYFSGGSWGGCEDPRIVRVNGEDVLYMTYTACDDGLRVGLTSIKVKDFQQKRWNWKTPELISQLGEIHKNWVIFPDKINGKYAILHSINPDISVAYVDNLEFADQKYIQSQHGGKPQKIPKKCWHNWVRGAGPPPLNTEYGWLVFYHAMDDRDPGKYKVGAMLLDLNDPTKILHRSSEPILEPNELYENDGFKSGIVYASGAIVKDGKLLVYYGGADSYVCVAYADFEEFIVALKQGAKIKLKKKKLIKKRILPMSGRKK